MPNIFDQFDESPRSGNVFDQFDQPEKPRPEEGGFVASVKSGVGAAIKGVGQAAADFIPGVDQDNAVKRYGQEVIDANPTAVRSLEDIADKPWTAAKEAAGNAGGSVAQILGARAVGQGITALAPLTGPAAPVTAVIGQAIAWFGPAAIAALPSYGGIRDKQILNDPENNESWKAKAVATLGAAAIGAIETKFGPQDWALAALTKEGRSALAEKFAATTLAGSVGKAALKGAAIEGAEELVQTPIEQVASGDDPTTAESLKDTAFGGAMGAMGGGLIGGGFGIAGRTQAKPDPIPEILDAPDVDSAIAAADAALSESFDSAPGLLESQPSDPLLGAMREREVNPPTFAPSNDVSRLLEGQGDPLAPMLEDRRIRTDAIDAVQQEAEQRKSAELDAIPELAAEQDTVAAALERAGALETPTAMQLALQRAQGPSAPVAEAATNVAQNAALPRVVERTAGMVALPQKLAEQRAAANPAMEVVRIQNKSGKFAYTVLPKVADSAIPATSEVADNATAEVSFDAELIGRAQKETKAAPALIRNALDNDAVGVIKGKPRHLDRDLNAGKFTEQEVADAWKEARALLRARHGDTVTLYRADAPESDRHPETRTLLMADRKTAEHFANRGRKVNAFTVSVDDVLAIYASQNDYFEAVVRVKGKPAGQPAAVVPNSGTSVPNEPAATWFGRRGDGYLTEGDARMAIPSRQRVEPDLSWKVEQLPTGKFRLAGYPSAAVKSQDANLDRATADQPTSGVLEPAGPSGTTLEDARNSRADLPNTEVDQAVGRDTVAGSAAQVTPPARSNETAQTQASQAAAPAPTAAAVSSDAGAQPADASAVRGVPAQVTPTPPTSGVSSAPSLSDSPEKWAAKATEYAKSIAPSAERVGQVADYALVRDTRPDWNQDDDGRILAVDKAGNVVADVFFGRRDDGKLEAAAEVAPAARRQGIASAIYDQIENSRGERLAPAEKQTADARAFWETRQRKAHAEKPETISAFPAKPTERAPDPVPQTAIKSLGIEEIPVSDLKLSSDVPQFKSGANEKGVVEALGGSFDRTGVAPIQVWRRANGDLEVISGRHRLDLAARSGETTIPAQVHDESAGFDVRRAAALDAELNIRDGQGKVRDYVQHFQSTGVTAAEADRRGLLARATGQRAFTIANDGDAELVAAHSAGQLSDEAAVSIARSAPKDSRLQAVGIKAVQDGKSIGNATNLMQAVKAMAAEGQGSESADMFGFDDSAMKEAEQMAKIASAEQRSIGERLSAIQGAAKRPELAKAEGINVNDPQAILRRAESLKQQRAAWDNWSTNPALVAQIKAKLSNAGPLFTEPDDAAPQPSAQEGKDADQGAMFARKGLTAEERSVNFRRWSNDAPLVTSAQAMTHAFKSGAKVVLEAFHGSKRPDRIGSVFKRQRATSGPMAFFTSAPELASSYAQGKDDTSLKLEETPFETWFKYKPPGHRGNPLNIVQAWYSLPTETQQRIAALAPRIQNDDTAENIILGPESNTTGNGGYDIREARGNPLKALVTAWLESGSIFGSEQEFMDVLRLAGFPVKDVTYDSPNAEYPSVYKTFVFMQKPLVTSDIPQEVRDALQAAAKRDRSRAQQGGADMWDKNTRTLREWVATMNDATNVMQSFVWTSIPDKVTDVFKSLGYDGIIDWSGKGGGHAHPVYIPFEETQVKSATGNKGTFDRSKKDITFAKGEASPSGLTPSEFTAAITQAFGPKVAERLESKGIVVPLSDQTSLPDNVVSLVRDNGIVYGFYDPVSDKTYAVLENLSADMVKGLVLHEVGIHYGFEAMLGKEKYANVIARVKMMGKAGNKQVIAARDKAKQNAAKESQVPEETLAYLVGENPEMTLVQEVIARIKAFLFDTFGIGGKYLTANDLTALARAAVLHASRADPEARQRDFEAEPAFSRSAVTGKTLPQTWQAPDESKLDDFIYSLQDKYIDTKRALESIRQTIGAIADEINPYQREELYHKRAEFRTKEFLQNQMTPLLAEMQARGVDMSDFEEYLHNRHAERRNTQVAKVNPNMPDGGSGIKTADAQKYLAGLPADKRKSYEALAKRVAQITKDTRKLLVDSGLEKHTTIAAWEGAYGDEYVPLMREEMDDGTRGIGQGYSVRGSASKRAMGSNKPVADIIANIALQREKAITRAEKKRIGEALYGLVLTAPNPDFWYAVDPELNKNPSQIMATQMQLISLGLDPKDAESIAQETVTRYIDKNGQVAYRINPAMRGMDNVLAVRIDGEDKFVFFNAKDDRALRMVTALKNLDSDQLGTVMGTVAKMTRYFAAVNTQWNPVFGVINFTRDVQTALLNLNSTPLKGHKADVMKHVLPALRGIYIDLRDHRAGKQPTSAYAQLFEEFMREGGGTGYRDMYANAQERTDAIVAELKAMKDGKALKLGKGILHWLSDYNEAMENAVRVAAYKVGKEQGLTNEQAASLAKNLTVNFNRKGQVALQAGALYAFFNASVQGTARIAQTLFEGGKLSALGKKIVTGGILLGSMQALLLAAAGFDDDEPPDFVRERALVLPIGDKKYIAIPMPLGFHILPNLGRIPSEWAMGGFKNTPKRIGQLVGLFADAFNPIGSAGLSLQTLTPTLIDPLAALSENRDWTGKPIAKKDFDSTRPTAGHTRAKDTATPWARLISYGANIATGGTDYKPGLASPTPDQIDYLIGQVTGGVGREAAKLAQVATSSVSGEDLPMHKIPLVGRFVGTTEGQSAEASRFYDNLREIGEHKVEIDGLRKDGKPVGKYISENREALLVPMAVRVQREVSKLNSHKRDLIKAGASKERVKVIDMQITARMKLLNDRVRAMESER